MSQQHPLIVFLLLIVMGACLALLAVFFGSGLVSTEGTEKVTKRGTISGPGAGLEQPAWIGDSGS